MSDSERENPRRLFLRVVAKLMAAFACVTACWVVLSPLFKPNVPVNAKIVETIIDVSEFREDSVDIIEWFDKPLIVARRSVKSESRLRDMTDRQLQDPTSEKSAQPEYARNLTRSRHDGWFVGIGLGTSSGCALRYSGVDTRVDVVFTDGCDSSQYDFAGRALTGGAAKKNIPVPHWRLENDRIIVSTEPVRN